MYHFFKVISSFLCKLQFKTVKKIASLLANLIYPFIKSQRFTARMNLSLIYPEKTYIEITSIIKENLRQIIITFLEIMRLPLVKNIDDANFFKHINPQYLEKAKSEKSVIFIGCHSGNWESVNVGTPSIMKYMVIVKRQKNAGFNRFITELRKQSGAKIVFDDDLRSITKLLKDNYSIAIMYDHGFKNSPLYTKFCNMEVQIPKSVFTLAQKYNRKLFPVFFSREESCNTIKYFEPITVEQDSIESTAQKLSNIFEQELHSDPYHYLWYYKRFKRSKSKQILVLTDSKPGHENQSISLANLIEDSYGNSHTRKLELKISRFKRLTLDLLVLLNFHKLFEYNTELIKILFPNNYNSIIKYTDIVISTGSSISSANRIISSCLNAKSCNIMRPNVNAQSFDRVIVPEHDFKAKNINRSKMVTICGAFKFTDMNKLKSDLSDFKTEFKLNSNESYASILIGGPLSKDSYDIDTIKKNLIKLKQKLIDCKYKIIISSSRRTPEWLEQFIEDQFKDASVKIIANKKNYSFAINGVLGISSAIISSADSISMISEAASFKDTYIVDIFNTRQSSAKHNAFISKAEQNNFVKLIDDGFNDFDNTDFSRVDNISTVRDAIKGLF